MATDIDLYSIYRDDAKYGSSAEGKYPKFEDVDKLLCKPKQEACIEKVRANLDKYHAFFAKHEKLTSKAIALTQFKAARSKFGTNIFSPVPNFAEPANWQLTTAAYWHVQGKQSEALDLACRAASSWRGMAENSQGLIDQMVGLAFYANMTRMLSELLSETSSEVALPTSCVDAYRPIEPKKFPICPSMQLEYRIMTTVGIGLESGDLSGPDLAVEDKWSKKITSLWLNKRATREEFALAYVDRCSDDSEVLEELAKPQGNFWIGLSFSEFAFNPVGGILAEISEGSYDDYSKRMQNISLTQAAMQAVLTQSLLMQSGKTSVQTGGSEISSGNKNVRFNKEAEAFEVDLYRSPSETQLLSLPLAGSRLLKQAEPVK